MKISVVIKKWVATSCMVLIFLCPFLLSGETIKRYRNHAPATINGYQKVECVEVGNDEKICSGLNESTGQFESLILTKEKIDSINPVGDWMGDTSNFEVVKRDLNSDGKEELIFAHLDGSSMGIGIHYWTISVFEYPLGRNAPLEYGVEDYGPSSFSKSGKSKEGILTTEWIMQSGSPAHKSNYFMGKWFDYLSGKLVQKPEVPILLRPYTFAFEEVRNSYSEFGTPEKNYPYCYPIYEWLTKSESKRVWKEPFYLEDTYTSKKGLVLNAERERGAGPVRFMIQISFDKDEKFTYGWKDDYKNYFNRIGDFGTGRLYPMGYIPSDPSAWLKGKRAELREYLDQRIPGRKEGFRVLWISEK